MKKNIILSVLALIVSGCCSTGEVSAVDEAKEMIRCNQAECVIVRENKIATVERGRGVNPLLKVYDEHRNEMKKSVIVDKVIGRAAAFIAIKGNAAEVFGKIMSEDAKALLSGYGIKSSCDLLVPKILNRKRNGLCPLEASVENIRDPDEALAALRRRIAELQRGMKK